MHGLRMSSYSAACAVAEKPPGFLPGSKVLRNFHAPWRQRFSLTRLRTLRVDPLIARECREYSAPMKESSEGLSSPWPRRDPRFEGDQTYQRSRPRSAAAWFS